MQINGLTHFELIVLLLLVLVAFLAVLAKRVHIPYPIVMVIGGLVVGFLPHIPRVALDPNVVFLIFLPPLLFSASFHISWRDFRDNLVSIVMLAFGLVGFSLVGVAVTTRAMIPGFDWKLGLVLGAVVAATDAIAATSTAKRLGLPRGIVDLLEAESLVNDGSGLLALKFTAAMVVTGVTPTLLEGTAQLFYLIAMAVFVGLAAGVVVNFFQSRISESPVEITISLVTPYVTYLVAESVHCSGVLAVIACGLYLGRRSSGFYSLNARIEASAFWRTLDFILNGLVFLLLGLQLPAILADIHDLTRIQLLIDGTIFSAIVILLRLLWVFPGAWLSEKIRHHVLRRREQRLSPRLVFLVGWAGMRGVLALAAAMSLPARLNSGAPFPQRSLIIFLTFCAIFATLVVQGLSMPALIRRLGLGGYSLSHEEETRARQEMIAGALQAIEQMRANSDSSVEALNAMEAYYQRQMTLLESSGTDSQSTAKDEAEALFLLGHKLRAVERGVVLRLRNEDQIHDEVLRTLERELDLLDARFASSA
jgi:monovalent cation/hydrogen antiporter